MTVILCLDDKNGMMFADRRQTKDRAVSERILAFTEGKRLLVSPYTASLFPEKKDLVVCEDPAKEGKSGDVLFLENTPFPQTSVQTVLCYRWNRRYPATRFFEKDLKKEGFTKKKKEDFSGFSHEKITEEIWQK